MPPAALNLVDEDPTGSTLPHTVDSATEFQSAINSLAEGVDQPEVRTTQEGKVDLTVVRVEKSDATGSGQISVTRDSEASAGLPADKSIEQDWYGVVLLPDRTKMSKAYTTDVALERIEAHPLTDDRLRVWVRVANRTNGPMAASIACNFSNAERKTEKTDFVPIKIAKGESIDAYFMSPMTGVTSYTILVR